MRPDNELLDIALKHAEYCDSAGTALQIAAAMIVAGAILLFAYGVLSLGLPI